MSIHHVLRLPAPVGTLLIGHRATFGRGRDLDVNLPEQAVRRLLLELSADFSTLAALRRFWQHWQYDPLRTNVNARDLVDRVALMTTTGTLQAYIANHRNANRDHFLANARRAIEQMLPDGFATPIEVGAQSVKRQVGISREMERLTQMVRRAADHLNGSYRQAYTHALDDKVEFATFLAALAAWMEQGEGAIGLVFDSLLTGVGIVYATSAKVEAARRLYRALEIIEKETLATRDIEAASWWFAHALTVQGPLELLQMILRGTKPPPACMVTTSGGYKPPPPVRQPEQRFLSRSARSSTSSSSSPSSPSGPLAAAAASSPPPSPPPASSPPPAAAASTPPPTSGASPAASAASPPPPSAADRLKELASQGHGPQRHEGDVTPQQLEDRAVKGFDPMTGTTTDGVTGGTHKYGRHATKINTPEDYVKAEEAMRNSKKFEEEAKKAKDAGIDTVVVDDVPLKDVLGDDYKTKLTGKTRVGSKNNPTGVTDTDFTDGTMKAVYKEDGKGGYNLITMYPEPV